jgi:hypothetical protein
LQSGQGHSLASLGEVAIIFGGVNENNDGCKGTYSYDPFTGNGWKNAVAPGRIQPKDRAFAAMTSFGPDQTSNPKLVLFGGYSPYTKEPLDDTWIFSMLDGWKNIQVNKGPSGRAYHGMVTNYLYAQGPRVAILFGGTVLLKVTWSLKNAPQKHGAFTRVLNQLTTGHTCCLTPNNHSIHREIVVFRFPLYSTHQEVLYFLEVCVNLVLGHG